MPCYIDDGSGSHDEDVQPKYLGQRRLQFVHFGSTPLCYSELAAHPPPPTSSGGLALGAGQGCRWSHAWPSHHVTAVSHRHLFNVIQAYLIPSTSILITNQKISEMILKSSDPRSVPHRPSSIGAKDVSWRDTKTGVFAASPVSKPTAIASQTQQAGRAGFHLGGMRWQDAASRGHHPPGQTCAPQGAYTGT